jgi:hypothetical protein
MALKLITLNDNILELNNLKNINNSYVITICGDARKGKSTFLNLIINYLTKENKEYFKISSSITHCTIGIDYYTLELNNKKYIFIDCQGLNFENSSNDVKLLLFLYTISNIFIYNDKNIINNNIFSTLQPMAMFINIFNSIDNKPILYFRIADYELDGDPVVLLNNLFEKRNDQYDNVRESIQKLFTIITIYTTDPITTVEKIYIKDKNYNLLINNFLVIIDNLFELIHNQICKNINLELLIDDINNNNKIDYKKLDIYTLNIQLEINDFIEKNIINNSEFDHIICDGNNTIRKLIDEYNQNIIKCKTLFINHFSTVPDEFKTIFNDKINDISKKYNKFIDTNEQIAKDFVDKIFLNTINNIYMLINNKYYSLIDTHFTFNDININIDDFKQKIILYDNNIVTFYITKYKTHLEKLKNLIDEIAQYNKTQFTNYSIKVDKVNTDIYNIINNIKEICQTYNGDYDKFLTFNHPYKNIKLNDYKKMNNEGNIIFYTINTELYIKNFIDKFYDKSKIPKYIDYFVVKLRLLINKTGIFINEPPFIVNTQIQFIKLEYAAVNNCKKILYVFIELTHFYEMLKFFNIKYKILLNILSIDKNGIINSNGLGGYIHHGIIIVFMNNLIEHILESTESIFINKQILIELKRLIDEQINC